MPRIAEPAPKMPTSTSATTPAAPPISTLLVANQPIAPATPLVSTEPSLAAEDAAEHAAEDGHGDEEEDRQLFQLEAAARAALRPARLRRRQALALDARHQLVDAGAQAARVVIAAERGADRALDDLARRQVGHRAFERTCATSMRMRRSSLATITSKPSPTSRRPIFQVSATRKA